MLTVVGQHLLLLFTTVLPFSSSLARPTNLDDHIIVSPTLLINVYYLYDSRIRTGIVNYLLYFNPIPILVIGLIIWTVYFRRHSQLFIDLTF